MARATVSIRVQPRARRYEFASVRDGVVVVRVTAPPLDGRANEAVARVLAARLGVRAAAVTILRGERARDKVVAIEGMTQAQVEQALGL
jgi:hypothetical protein